MTAILFVCAAETLPHVDTLARLRRESVEFYVWLGILFGFDVIVLAADYAKNPLLPEWLKSYVIWGALNVVMCVICFVGAALVRGHIDMLVVSMTVCGCAALRTGVDYATSKDTFMFP